MRGRIRVLGAAALGALAIGAVGPGTAGAAQPEAEAAGQFREVWQGVWRFTHGPGVLRLTQDGREISGRYGGGGPRSGGTIEGRVQGLAGEQIRGEYCDDYRKPGARSRCGSFIASIRGEADAFAGSFRPYYRTTRYRWGGVRLSG
jgi:hypothetical protein